MHLDIVSSQNYNLGWDCMSKSHMGKRLDLHVKNKQSFYTYEVWFYIDNISIIWRSKAYKLIKLISTF